MRAKIMLLTGKEPGKALAAYAEQLLTDISAAFGHSFSLMIEKLPEDGEKEEENLLSDSLLDRCQQCRGILLCDPRKEAAEALYDGLELPIRLRSFCVPEALCGRHEPPLSLWTGTCLSLDEETLRQSLHTAFAFAKEEDTAITHIPPTGSFRAEWEAQFRVQEVSVPQIPVHLLSAPDAISSLIASPARLGLLFGPPYAGSIAEAAAEALCAQPTLMHALSFDENIGVYAPFLSENEQEAEPNPFSMVLSVAKLLRYSLHLGREAACVEAALNNVLSAGWRTPDLARSDASRVTTKAILDLICEQIAIAGELMSKSDVS